MAGRKSLNWDVIGLTSVAITIAGAAIFYIAGWVYEAHWYGYYGVEVSQLNLAPYVVMVQGVPGIIFLAVSGAVFLALFSILKRYVKAAGVQKKDLPVFILGTYCLCFLVLGGVAIWLNFVGTGGVPWEIWLSLVPGIVALASAIAFIRYRHMLDWPIYTFARNRVLKQLVARKQLGRVGRFYLIFLLEIIIPFVDWNGMIDEDLRSEIVVAERAVRAEIEQQKEAMMKSIITTWQFWIAIMIFFLFFTSISASALIGEFDARRGARSLSGNRHLSTAFIYSEQEINTLREHLYESDEEVLVYGPLYILSSDSDTLLLTEPKPQSSEGIDPYYQQRPALYAVMRDEIEGFTLSASTSP